MTLTTLRASILVEGTSGGDPSWDQPWRSQLVDNLEILCGHLASVGITEVFADGSFATNKSRPGDIDGYYPCDFMNYLQHQLPRLITKDEAWDLTRRVPDAHGKLKPLMWHRYRVELFPQYNPPFHALSRAADDLLGRPVLFPEFFRHTRAGTPRGIVRIMPEPKP
jgi:hypothetical protein